MKKIVLDLTKPVKDITVTEDCEISGVFVGSGKKSIQSSFQIIHALPGLKSRIHLKAVLKYSASLDLTPLIVVEKGAKLCDTYLKIDVLILSPNAHVRVLPGMKIKENEVKAGHGATIGRPDAKQMLYLRSRGLSQEEAEDTLVTAFLQANY